MHRLVLLPCRGFPKKASRTARIASDEEIQGTKDAVIQDLERKLRFKEDLLNNGQPVWRGRGLGLEHTLPTWGSSSPASLRLRFLGFVHKPDFIAFGSLHSSEYNDLNRGKGDSGFFLLFHKLLLESGSQAGDKGRRADFKVWGRINAEL